MLKIKLMFLLIYAAILGIIGSCLAEEFNWLGFIICILLIVFIVFRLRSMFKNIDKIKARLRNKGLDNGRY